MRWNLIWQNKSIIPGERSRRGGYQWHLKYNICSLIWFLVVHIINNFLIDVSSPFNGTWWVGIYRQTHLMDLWCNCFGRGKWYQEPQKEKNPLCIFANIILIFIYVLWFNYQLIYFITLTWCEIVIYCSLVVQNTTY